MRLRKLILSTGLAVAMVATTIPVGAATGGFYKDSQEYDATFIAHSVQTPKGTKTDNGSNVIITAGDLSSGSVGTVSIIEAANAKLTLYKSDNKLTKLEPVQTAPGPITTTQSFEYKLSKSATVTGDTNGTPDNDLTANVDETVPAVITGRNAAVTEAIAELNALGIGTFEKDNSTPAPTLGTGEYNVTVNYTHPTKDTSTDYGSIGYGITSTTPITLSVTGVDDDSKATITTTFTVDYTHTITNLSALGATYKFGKKVDGNTAGTQYTLLKVSTDGTIEEVKTGYGSAEGTDLSADITDLTCAYYLATKEVSTSDKLDASPEEDATYTGVINQLTTVTGTAAEKLAEAIEANSAKLVAYLDVKAFKTDDQTATKLDETPYELTFKIAVPADVDTTGVVFKVLRYHGSTVDVLDTTVSDGYIYFKTDKFSAYALVTVAADAAETPAETPAEDPTTETPANEDTQAAAETPEAANGTAAKSATGVKSGDNSMMPIVVVSLLLALCAGSVAVYKEKKTL